MAIAKLFWTGRSQAVRLPKAFRIDDSEVRIRWHGSALILEPIPRDWGWLDALAAPIDADLQQAAAEQPLAEERKQLDQLFE